MLLAAVGSDTTVISCSPLSPAGVSDIGDNDSTVLQRGLITLRLAVSSPARTRSAP